VIMNSEEAATGPSSGDEIAAAADGFDAAALAESQALADKQSQETTEATTRMERHRGISRLDSSWGRRNLTQPGVCRGEQGLWLRPRNQVVPYSRACDSWPLIPNSNVGQNNLSFSIIQAISSVS